MRQTRLFEQNNPEKVNLRVTRGHSDLPKQQEKEESEVEEESISEEEEDGVPKVKKIHHMTLKAMERKKILAELAALQGITLEQKPVVKIPKKRGRPKGYKKPVVVQEEYIVNEIQLNPLSGVSQKKQINLRKRDSTKKFVEPDSQMINQNEVQVQQLKEVVMQIKLQLPPKPIVQQLPVPPSAQAIIPHVPKKRGRKKKIQPEMVQPPPLAKVFTVPKTQTYDNYNKFYRKITEEPKQENGGELPLIFDKLNNSEGYEQLLRTLQLKK